MLIVKVDTFILSNQFWQMELYQKFIIELQTLEIDNLVKYDYDSLQYKTELKKLQQLAVSEFLLFTPQQTHQQLKHLYQIDNRFKTFWPLYQELYKKFREGKIDNELFEEKICNLFIIPKQKSIEITFEVIRLLQEAIMLKGGVLQGFIDQVKRATTTKNNTKGRKDIETFEGSFLNPDHAKTVKDILEIREYTKEGKWMGISKNKTELLALYYVLRPFLNTGKPTTQARIFYNEFGLDVPGYMSERNLTEEPYNTDRDEFEGIFDHLVNH